MYKGRYGQKVYADEPEKKELAPWQELLRTSFEKPADRKIHIHPVHGGYAATVMAH